MIQYGKHIIAEKGKLLKNIWDQTVCGKEAWLGFIYYNKDGQLLPEPFEVTADDYVEVDNPEPEQNYEVIDEKIHYFIDMTYAEIKSYVVKLHYSVEDQMALVLNYEKDPDKYRQRYAEMQDWRDYATVIATKYAKE